MLEDRLACTAIAKKIQVESLQVRPLVRVGEFITPCVPVFVVERERERERDPQASQKRRDGEIQGGTPELVVKVLGKTSSEGFRQKNLHESLSSKVWRCQQKHLSFKAA